MPPGVSEGNIAEMRMQVDVPVRTGQRFVVPGAKPGDGPDQNDYADGRLKREQDRFEGLAGREQRFGDLMVIGRRF